MGPIHIESLLKKVEKPGRYIGGEFNEIRRDHASVGTTFAFAFPDLYEIGMSYMGMQILYSIINHEEDLLCERGRREALDFYRPAAVAAKKLAKDEPQGPFFRGDLMQV